MALSPDSPWSPPLRPIRGTSDRSLGFGHPDAPSWLEGIPIGTSMKRPLITDVAVPCERSNYAIEVDKPKVAVIRDQCTRP
jgi:hypothetical protein